MILRQGSRSHQVRVLQLLLNGLLKPSPNLRPDGDFGARTRDAECDYPGFARTPAAALVPTT